MEFLGSVVDIIRSYWDPISQQFGYFKDLNINVETLMKKTAKLKRKRDEIQADVDEAISFGKRQKPQVEKWLANVRKIETKVDSITLEFEQGGNHFSRYKLGKRVVKKLERVKKLTVKGVFDEVADSPRWPRVLERQPSLPRGQSTSEQTMEQIWQCLHGEENGVIGVYGMGGIGKTTLMQAINNKFIGTNYFNVVIWVTVSKDLNLALIQEKIRITLGIRFDNNEDIAVKRDRLFTRLKNMSYLLILDDLWKSFSLDQVGIPKPDNQNRCKIVITTRSLTVCNAMRADKVIKVRALTWEEAWTLFRETCGDVVLSSEIQPVAQKIVRECSRLPLAIKTVGGVLRHKDRKEVWENALRALKGSSPEVPGMEPEVFLPLKLSYDSLEHDEMKLCFLYCSLFPEDYDIPIDDLVRYWTIEEGFIKNVKNLEEASNKVHDILERIKDACLLEEHRFGYFSGYRSKYVKMHDLLRDLAIWITSPTSPSSIKGSKFLAEAGKGLVQPPEENMWGGMERISLMRNQIQHLQIIPDCHNLVSLFLNSNRGLRTIHSSFFKLMPKLQILDLSDTGIKSLPESLSLLVNLRALIVLNCEYLVEVPSLGNLKELRDLDLSYSGIKNLPQGIESLVKLKRLGLSCYNLTAIPWNIIYELPYLEDLNMHSQEGVDGATFSEFASMIHLTSLNIRVTNANGFIATDMFLQWFSGLKRFHVYFVYQPFSEYWPRYSDKQIMIEGCDSFPCGIEGLIKHAISLCFYKCKGAKSLSQLVGYSKSLRELYVDGFSGVECIINWGEVGDDALQSLQELDVRGLPNLKVVFDGGAEAPPRSTRLLNLRCIQLGSCPKLRCLFSPSMVEHLHQLEVLVVRYCDEMEEIIEGDMLPLNSFPRLRNLHLERLPKLVSICSQ